MMNNRDGWVGVPNSSTDELGASFGEFRVQTPRAGAAPVGQLYHGANFGHPPPQQPPHGLQHSLILPPQMMGMCRVSVVDLCRGSAVRWSGHSEYTSLVADTSCIMPSCLTVHKVYGIGMYCSESRAHWLAIRSHHTSGVILGAVTRSPPVPTLASPGLENTT